MLLWLVVALPGVIMLVVIAFLIQAATAYGQFALPGIPFSEVNTRVPARAVHRCLDLAGIRNIRLPFENAKLLLVSFLALHDRLRWRDFLSFIRGWFECGVRVIRNASAHPLPIRPTLP